MAAAARPVTAATFPPPAAHCARAAAASSRRRRRVAALRRRDRFPAAAWRWRRREAEFGAAAFGVSAAVWLTPFWFSPRVSSAFRSPPSLLRRRHSLGDKLL